jgi:1,2-dihydroxy-3-keto-5-methylthiopentene dioxygenase
MASITVPEQNRTFNDPAEISSFLAPHGIWYEKWDVDNRVAEDATNDEILAAYSEEIDRLKAKGNFQTADVVNVTPETPNLDAMLAKFNKEHTHAEDEVRFTVRGRGLFFIHPKNGPVFSITVERGDLINVPAGTQHWFELCDDRTIRCIRLFQDSSGWAPLYVEKGVHAGYAPVCWGPNYVPRQSLETPSAVKV